MIYTCATYGSFATQMKRLENELLIETNPEKLAELSIDMVWLQDENPEFNQLLNPAPLELTPPAVQPTAMERVLTEF